MPRRLAALCALFICLPMPPAVASSGAAAGAEGPDADGAFTLHYDVTMAATASVVLALDVLRTDADGTLAGTRDLGARELPAGSTRVNATFLPAEGAGHYDVALLVDGVAVGTVSFEADDAGATGSVTFEVPDAPTTLALTNEEVNANGKVKSPGDALVTRATLRDDNGVGDVDAVLWRVTRDGAIVEDGAFAPGSPAATSALLEHRYDRSPLAAAGYAVDLLAMKGGAIVANASRTFVIREVAPTFVSGALPNVTPDETQTRSVPVVIADKNGAPNGTLEARVYRASTRVEGAGFAATLGAPIRLADVNGTGHTAYALSLTVPARAASGAYRVSLYHDGSLLSSIPFGVAPLPTLASVEATTSAGRLVLDARGAGDGHLLARLTDGNGATTIVAEPFTNGTGTLTLDAPRRGAPLTWNVTLHARADGPALAWREGNWSAPLDGPSITLAPIHVRRYLPAVWAVGSPWDLSGATATVDVARWDGVDEPRVNATLAGDRLRLDAPADLPAGRYTANLRLAWANGSASEATWTFDAGPWVQLTLGEPVVSGRNATVAIRNDGGLAVSKLIVETGPRAALALDAGSGLLSPTMIGERAAFSGLGLAPGEEATLRLALPDGPARSGTHTIAIRVLARVEVA